MSVPNEGQLFGRQRRANAEGGPRQKRYTVKVTGEEDVQLTARAVARSVTVPRLMVETAMSAHIETDTDRKAAIAELFAVRRLLANVANNVNQIARFANEEKQFPADAQAVVEEYRALVPRISAAIEELSGS
ncbi:plasmid mobilization relaxosome protein MobC [Frigoribacterium sp. CFBP 8754]|uniref:plasmid mobilization relaxosome protein MobC n=1 Tax=Frigoribacterium sp. CFBP 8754 TaxID=2775290 RepID=UPI0018D889F7|nr:plasmid mobilization relaxosome protein MobC [Frigoribacterium sp. CFBP 8754]